MRRGAGEAHGVVARLQVQRQSLANYREVLVVNGQRGVGAQYQGCEAGAQCRQAAKRARDAKDLHVSLTLATPELLPVKFPAIPCSPTRSEERRVGKEC